MDEVLKTFLENHRDLAYPIIFVWCMAEGELALILGGIFAHEGHVNLAAIIFVAGCGGFAGDQVYFYIGRCFKSRIQKRLRKQRRKFALAHLLLKHRGSVVIFIQRYMYGFRTVIPMSIGLTRYSARKFAVINFISAQIWAAITILLAWHFGQQIWAAVRWAGEHWYVAIPLVVAFWAAIIFGFKRLERQILMSRRERLAGAKSGENSAGNSAGTNSADGANLAGTNSAGANLAENSTSAAG